MYSFLEVLVGFLADVDFNSERLRFLGGARFDVYAAYQLLAHKPVRARVAIDQQTRIDHTNEMKLYHSICIINLEELSPGFIFDKAGVSLVPSTTYLLPFLLRPTCNSPLPSKISIEFEKETSVSIDGECYKITGLHGERLDSSGVFAPW